MRKLARMTQRESRRAASVATVLFAAIALTLLVAGTAGGQSQPTAPVAISAGGAELQYLRARSLLDTARSASFLIQPFSAAADSAIRGIASRASGDAAGPSASEAPRGPAWARLPERIGPVSLALLPLDVAMVYNTALPVDRNDGVVWAGRGATVVFQGGVGAQWKWLRGQIAPVLFSAQNTGFELAPNGRLGQLVYADARFPISIDAPQRFGAETYARMDWGDSFLEATAVGMTVGLSNARQQWGPGREYPLVLSTNSGGFAHGFIGTAMPRNIGIGRVHLRLIAGRLEQSAYSSVQTGERSRFLSGLVGTFTPAGLPGLELGALRIANGRWGPNGLTLSQILRPLQGIINDNVSGINSGGENQFAALFFRFAPPGAGFEAYGEISREDFAGTWRALVLEPDDLVDFTLGITQARRGADGTLGVLRFELVNAATSHQERLKRTLLRPHPPYTHSGTPQGLTNRGQLLGSPVAYGGGGATVAWERHDTNGWMSVAAERVSVLDWLPAQGMIGGVPHAEVRYGLRTELVRAHAGREWGVVVAPSLTLNRNIEQGQDVLNVNVQLRWRGL